MYWFKFIVNVVYKVLVIGNVEDVRSDDEDELNGVKVYYD